MKVDIIMTTYNRLEMLRRAVESVIKNTTDYRLFISDDCSQDGTRDYLLRLQKRGIARTILKERREGVVPGFNNLWRMVEDDDSEYVCYLQDDMLVLEPGWLDTIMNVYKELWHRMQIGFFSGYHAKEHPEITRMAWRGREILLKDSSTASNLIATKNFWQSIGIPIPLVNPCGKPRGFPHNGNGSSIDIYLTGCCSLSRFSRRYSSPTSSYKQGKTLMVIPGLLEHMGFEKGYSTWRSERQVGF